MASLSNTGRERWLLPLSGILLVMGALLGVQVHTQMAQPDALTTRRTSAIAEIFHSSQEQVQSQKTEIDGLRRQLAKYEQEAAEGRGDFPKLLSEQLQADKMSLGLIPLHGPGILFEVGDATARPSSDAGLGDIDPFIVHDSDLALAVNELWANGAEAISLNGQRLVSGSAIVCSGRLVQVNREIIPSPFVFTVIGDPKTLISGLSMPSGLLDQFRLCNFKLKVTRQADVVVPAIAVQPKFKFARPVPADRAAELLAAQEPKS